jgi:hypothetical protein
MNGRTGDRTLLICYITLADRIDEAAQLPASGFWPLDCKPPCQPILPLIPSFFK